MIQLSPNFASTMLYLESRPVRSYSIIQHHLEQYLTTNPDLVCKLCRSFYVDDFISGAADEEQAYQLFVKSTEMMKDGGFNLCKFSSNSVPLQSRVESTQGSNTEQPPQVIHVSENTFTNLLL